MFTRNKKQKPNRKSMFSIRTSIKDALDFESVASAIPPRPRILSTVPKGKLLDYNTTPFIKNQAFKPNFYNFVK